MIGDIMQPTHLLFVLVIALLVLGPKRLPEVGRQLGKGLRDFRSAINGDRPDHHDELDDATADVNPRPAAQPVEDHATNPESATQPVEPYSPNGTTEPAPVEHHTPAGTTEPSADPQDHQFAHASPELAGSEHQFAHEEPVPAPIHEVDAGPVRPAGEHEFAYDPSPPAEKPADRTT